MFDWGIWKQIQKIDNDDEFIDDSERRVFLEYLNDPSMILMEMANVRGIDTKIENRLPFSFFFTNKRAVHNQHGIRLKILWNPSKNPKDADGYIELHGNYEYVSGSHKYKPTKDELRILREFVKKYKVLFSAVWEEKLYDGDLQDFFKGRISIKELLSKFDDISEKNYYTLNHCNSLEELEQCIRKYKIFNMND